MKILVTAGGTFSPIDKVRGIDNIFNGRTGCNLTKHFLSNDEDIILLLRDSSKYFFEMSDLEKNYKGKLRLLKYRTFNDLLNSMEMLIKTEKLDVILHSSAVADYSFEGMYMYQQIETDPNRVLCGSASLDEELVLLPPTGKYKSNYDELFIKLIRNPKIIDMIRNDWGFKGILVKFKLEVEKSDEELLTIAKQSRIDSNADIIIANCLEWANERAFVITENSVTDLKRDMLAPYLYGEISMRIKS